MKYLVLQHKTSDGVLTHALQDVDDDDDTYSTIPMGVGWAERVGQTLEAGVDFERVFEDCGNHTCKCPLDPSVYLKCSSAYFYAYLTDRQ